MDESERAGATNTGRAVKYRRAALVRKYGPLLTLANEFEYDGDVLGHAKVSPRREMAVVHLATFFGL